MDELDNELLLNKAKLTIIVDGYLQQFKKEYPLEKRNLDALSEFMQKHNMDYRRSVAELTTLTVHNLISNGNSTQDKIRKVLDDNGWNIGMLLVAIGKECGLPLETKYL